MRAVIVSEPGPLETHAVVEVDDPVPGEGEVVIDVRAAEVNFPDLLVAEGRYQVRPPPPFSPGKAAAGVIAAVGPGVPAGRVGERVSVQVEYGAFAEKLRAAAASAFTLPDGMPFAEAAALGLTYQTAWFALVERARLLAGECVLVLGGSGGVGVASVQLAKALGAGTVIASVRAAEDAAVARQAGADGVVLVGGDVDVRQVLRDGVRALAPEGADVVIDPVGGVFGAAALRSMAWCGRLVVVGFAAGGPPEVRANYLLVKNIAVLGLQWSDYRDRHPDRVAAAQRSLFRLHGEGRLRPVIDRILPLEAFAEALRALQDGVVQGKIILDPRLST